MILEKGGIEEVFITVRTLKETKKQTDVNISARVQNKKILVGINVMKHKIKSEV